MSFHQGIPYAFNGTTPGWLWPLDGSYPTCQPGAFIPSCCLNPVRWSSQPYEDLRHQQVLVGACLTCKVITRLQPVRFKRKFEDVLCECCTSFPYTLNTQPTLHLPLIFLHPAPLSSPSLGHLTAMLPGSLERTGVPLELPCLLGGAATPLSGFLTWGRRINGAWFVATTHAADASGRVSGRTMTDTRCLTLLG